MSDSFSETTAEFPAFRTSPPSAPSSRPRLVVLRGPNRGSRFELGTETVIGRATECDVRVLDASISRRHARIVELPDGTCEVEDLGSRNGTWLDGMVVSRAPLAPGTRLDLGQQITLLFTCEDPLEHELRERQKMEAIGRMAAGIAHDFNNVVGAAQATLEHLEGILGPLPAEARECVTDLDLALERAVELTHALATLGRRGETPREAVRVAEVLEEVARLCLRTFRAEHRIQVEAANGLHVFGSQTELHQVPLNLCLNARDAMPDGGAVVMRAHQVADRAVISVNDTGVGMPPETLEHAFEPFFTTKALGHGTGLGLATVAELVRGMGGCVEVSSEPGRGTAFRIVLPAVEPPACLKSPEKKNASRMAASQGARVLIADDQELVRRSLERLLRAAGYEVLVARDGEHALRIYRTEERKPDLLLLDLDMPGLTGRDVVETLGGLAEPPLMVVISGYWDPTRRDELTRLGAAAYLAKPVSASALRRTVASLLRRAEASPLSRAEGAT